MRVRIQHFYAVSRPDGVVTEEQQAVLGAAMTIALQRLNRMIDYLAVHDIANAGNLPANFVRALQVYFRLADPPPAGAAMARILGQIRGNLVAIRDGLLTRNIEIVANAATKKGVDMSRCAGYVAMKWTEAFRFKDATRPATFSGRIHIRFANVREGNEVLCAGTLVHEASHRFNGARDWSYLPVDTANDMLAYEDDYIARMGRANGLRALHVAPFYAMTAPQALNNADSFAGFAMCAPTEAARIIRENPVIQNRMRQFEAQQAADDREWNE